MLTYDRTPETNSPKPWDSSEPRWTTDVQHVSCFAVLTQQMQHARESSKAGLRVFDNFNDNTNEEHDTI